MSLIEIDTGINVVRIHHKEYEVYQYLIANNYATRDEAESANDWLINAEVGNTLKLTRVSITVIDW